MTGRDFAPMEAETCVEAAVLPHADRSTPNRPMKATNRMPPMRVRSRLVTTPWSDAAPKIAAAPRHA